MRQVEREFHVRNEMIMAYSTFMDGLEKAINLLDKDIAEAAEMSEICTDEWCTATEHVIDDLHKSLYSISEPRGSSEDVSHRLGALRHRLRDLYVKYKAVVEERRAA